MKLLVLCIPILLGGMLFQIAALPSFAQEIKERARRIQESRSVHPAAEGSTRYKPSDIASLPVRELRVEKLWDKHRPSSVPLVPAVLREVHHYGGEVNHPALSPDERGYEPLLPGGFAINNGPRYFNRPLFFRGNTVGAGDRPLFAITRSYIKSWASKLRFGLSNRRGGKWLDEFAQIRAEFYVGYAYYRCRDHDLGIDVELWIAPTMEGWGTVARLRASGEGLKGARAAWVYGDISTAFNHPDGGYWIPAKTFGSAPANVVERAGEGILRLTVDTGRDPQWKHALGGMDLSSVEFFIGTQWANQQAGSITAAEANGPPGEIKPGTAGTVAAAIAPLSPTNGVWEGYLTLVWGGQENSEAVRNYEGAMRRLGLEWGMRLYRKWYENYLGRGQNPRGTFDLIYAHPAGAMARALEFWKGVHSRIQIETPDRRFNSFANWLAASQEYLHWPVGQMSGIHAWGLSYLHISNMYSGWDYLGAHDQQEEWLRLFATSVRNGWIGLYHGIAPWNLGENARGGEEDQIGHYVNDVYEHWLWTGDERFVRDIWPALQSLIAREIRQSDPDNDGLFAARYPYWGPENSSWGPSSEIQSAQMYRALAGAAEMAEAIHDTASAGFYRSYAERIHGQLQSRLWNSEHGMLGYRDPMDVQMLQPECSAIFMPILREAVDNVQAYQMLRYIRDNLWSEVVPGVARIWTCNHFGRMHKNGPTPDIPLNAASAGLVAGATDAFWPAVETVVRSYFYSSWPGAQGDTIFPWGAGGASMNDHNDGRMPALYLLGRALFGLEPDLPHQRLTIRPRFPSHWSSARIKTPDIEYRFERAPSEIKMEVSTTETLAKTVRLPVRQGVSSVFVDGRSVRFRLDERVNAGEVVVEIPSGKSNTILVRLSGRPVAVKSPRTVARSVEFTAFVEAADKVELYDPQACVASFKPERDRVRLTPDRTGPKTVFLRVHSGNVSFLWPLDLDIREPLEILDGRLVENAHALEIHLRNYRPSGLSGSAVLTISGQTETFSLNAPAQGEAKVRVPLSERTRQVLTPGLNDLEVSAGGETCRYKLIDWELAHTNTDIASSLFDRTLLLDLAWYYHEQANSLFNTKWYYDVWQMGIDYPVLPPATYEWSNQRLEDPQLKSPRFLSAPGIPFYVTTERKLGGVYQDQEGGGPRNILPVANWRPFIYPTNITIDTEGERLSKAYFLAYSWERGQKTYHPNVELIANYEDGSREIRQLIPPYSFTPQYGLRPVGRNPYRAEVIHSGLSLGPHAAADVYDLPLRPERRVKTIEVRSVTSESIFGIFGVTLVRSPLQDGETSSVLR